MNRHQVLEQVFVHNDKSFVKHLHTVDYILLE
ncbi:unnamed protein product [Schistosoma mattheei]|uniref:Uncharacterized protein n=1 Tax=Schistosoma mattheei TaxID=31246 RepID=A0A3P7XD62_9TREM|nr:unnamed protein product [Schistosoma mattheei]